MNLDDLKVTRKALQDRSDVAGVNKCDAEIAKLLAAQTVTTDSAVTIIQKIVNSRLNKKKEK